MMLLHEPREAQTDLVIFFIILVQLLKGIRHKIT